MHWASRCCGFLCHIMTCESLPATSAPINWSDQNIGLTLQATRQAITDTRRCLRWLEQQGYTRLGLVGTSIGSAVGSITIAHDPAVRAGAFLHVSTYFADAVRTG